MYSKELEELIENVLEDGVITDLERAVLRKRAEASGEDPDEVMIVIEGRLAKMKKAAKPANEKRGNVVKCPNCGASVPAGATKCSECGYVFTNVEVNTTAKEFATELDKRIAKAVDKQAKDRVVEFIRNYPLPTGKEEMLEFIAGMDARRRSTSEYHSAYVTKYKECVTKVEVLFPGDEDFKNLLERTEKSDYSGGASRLVTIQR